MSPNHKIISGERSNTEEDTELSEIVEQILFKDNMVLQDSHSPDMNDEQYRKKYLRLSVIKMTQERV